MTGFGSDWFRSRMDEFWSEVDELFFLDRKMSLKRPTGEASRREEVRGLRSDDVVWLRGARFSESTEPERSLECVDVLEATSAYDVSGGWTCW